MIAYVVSCGEHGLMERDEPRLEYRCRECPHVLTDEELHELTARIPGNAIEPVQIQVL
jgi:hypothetical protein